ncbi:MAG: hypothetical protein IJU44_05735 [Kiritimatiellae bacterium]|nr:hypothetical protein [Kiritimatiellia bacterium]
MIKKCLALALVLAAGRLCAQQFPIKLELAYNAFVVGEPVLVQITLENDDRQDIVIDEKSRDRIFFELTTEDRYNYIKQYREGLVAGAFTVSPRQNAQRRLELDKWHSLMSEGKYFVQAVFLHNGQRYVSQLKTFDIVPGLKLKEGIQMFVKPANLKRTFTLSYWHRNEVDRLFLRAVDEPSGLMWDTVDLGTFSRAYPAKLDIAPDGVVSVVHKSNQDVFFRTVLWSLPESLEVVERNKLLDPEVAASQNAKSLYNESGDKKSAKKPWWKLW